MLNGVYIIINDMNSCNKCNKCNDCDPCKKKCGGCGPAQFRCDFDINVSPYDPSTWMVTICGATKKVKAPCCPDIDTTLTANYSNGTLTYKSEYHEDVITGAQLGDVINLDDLRNVDIDNALDGHCYELVYRKYANCGDGCRSAADKWENFNINTEDVKRNGIRFVRGANEFGCPVYLDIPPKTDEYWLGMWRPVDGGNGLEFGYIQPEHVDELPKDDDGNTLVWSQLPNGKPVLGPIAASLCARAKEFVARQATPTARNYFLPNATTEDEIMVVPDDDPSWRAPCCGIIYVGFCVNPYMQNVPHNNSLAEIDVTIMLDDESYDGKGGSKERYMSTHSTWTWQAGTVSCSETCSAMRVVPKGRTIKLHARNTGDNTSGMNTWGGQWRVHAVRSVFIPLEIS